MVKLEKIFVAYRCEFAIEDKYTGYVRVVLSLFDLALVVFEYFVFHVLQTKSFSFFLFPLSKVFFIFRVESL